MAQKVTVELVDDLDGSASGDVSTVEFGLDGVSYAIDLNDDNADRLRETLAEFLAASRRTGGRRKPAATTGTRVAKPAADREQIKAIRDWGRSNGFDLAERGRIPAHVIEAFEQAQVSATPTRRRSKAKAT